LKNHIKDIHMRRKLAAGNWKMNGTLAGLEMLADVAAAMDQASAEAVICPPAPFLLPAVTKARRIAMQSLKVPSPAISLLP
jgi:triosephosphate isomerase